MSFESILSSDGVNFEDDPELLVALAFGYANTGLTIGLSAGASKRLTKSELGSGLRYYMLSSL